MEWSCWTALEMRVFSGREADLVVLPGCAGISSVMEPSQSEAKDSRRGRPEMDRGHG